FHMHGPPASAKATAAKAAVSVPLWLRGSERCLAAAVVPHMGALRISEGSSARQKHVEVEQERFPRGIELGLPAARLQRVPIEDHDPPAQAPRFALEPAEQ